MSQAGALMETAGVRELQFAEIDRSRLHDRSATKRTRAASIRLAATVPGGLNGMRAAASCVPSPESGAYSCAQPPHTMMPMPLSATAAPTRSQIVIAAPSTFQSQSSATAT